MRVQQRSANRTEWFRRPQWAWELTQRSDAHSVTAGMVMMDYLADATNRKDVIIIDGIAPIARRIGSLIAESEDASANLDIARTSSDTKTVLRERTVTLMAKDRPASDPVAEDAAPARRLIYVDDAQIAAAKLQLTLDRKLGRKSLDIVRKIAAVK